MCKYLRVHFKGCPHHETEVVNPCDECYTTGDGKIKCPVPNRSAQLSTKSFIRDGKCSTTCGCPPAVTDTTDFTPENDRTLLYQAIRQLGANEVLGFPETSEEGRKDYIGFRDRVFRITGWLLPDPAVHTEHRSLKIAVRDWEPLLKKAPSPVATEHSPISQNQIPATWNVTTEFERIKGQPYGHLFTNTTVAPIMKTQLANYHASGLPPPLLEGNIHRS